MGEAMPGRQPPSGGDTPIAHGGDLDVVRAMPGAYPGDWIDLSTGINPFPYPLPPPAAGELTRLPAAADLAALVEAARHAYCCSAAAQIVPVPGTQAAIQWLPRLFAPARVTVLGPTYTEHAHVWRQSGHAVEEIDSLPGTLARTDVLVAVNPNNPDGRALGPELLRRWHRELASRGGWLVLDEAFADCIPDVSLAADAGAPGLVILRSFGKFFGLAGLRLGFVLADPVLAAGLRASLGPWAVSGPAIAAGRAALADAAWQAAMRQRLSEGARSFDAQMRERGIHVLGGTPLFRLAKLADAAGFAAALRRVGIHVRVFAHQPHWVRLGVPPDGAAFFTRLDAALAAFPLQGGGGAAAPRL